MLKTYLKWIAGGLLVALVVIQFFGIDTQNPPEDASMAFTQLVQPPTEVSSLLENACYDCHSNSTTYPWYTRLQPVGWWIAGHIDHGRDELNFSEWGTYDLPKRIHKMEEVAEEVEERHMPMSSYTWMHAEAKLSDEQRAVLVTWFEAKAKEAENPPAADPPEQASEEDAE